MSRRIKSLAVVAIGVALALPAPRTGWAQTEQTDLTAEQVLERALTAPTEFSFENAPLADVMDYFAKRHGVNIRFDQQALADEGIGPDQAVTIKLEGVSLQAALKWVLEPLELTMVTDQGILIITSPAAEEDFRYLRVYPVRDLRVPNHWQPMAGFWRRYGGTEYENLIESITTCIAPDSWNEVGGPGSIAAHPPSGTLVVSQTRSIQAEIERLLADLRWVRDHQTQPPAPAWEAAIRQALAAPAELDFENVPLVDVLKHIAEKYGIRIYRDELALTDEGVSLDIPVTCHLKQVPLSAALRLVLRELNLTYVPWHEVLLITSITAAEDLTIAKVYAVRELVQWPTESGPYSDCEEIPDYESVIEVITSSVRPDSWDEGTGPTTVGEFPFLGALVIEQTYAVHEEIAKLLADMREARRQQQPDGEAEAAPPGDTDQALEIRVYKVFATGGIGGAGVGGGMFQMGSDPNAPPVQDLTGGALGPPAVDPVSMAKQLAKAIPRLIEPESWEAAGGPGIILTVGDNLIVRQTPRVHRQVRALLGSLY